MKFDVIISNPPYQLSDGGNGASAKPIYQMFVQQAKKMRPKYMLMITPSRWFAGGKGLDAFRKEMLQDRHLTRIVDYQNAKDCFPGVSVGGGICYFKWDRDTISDCTITNIINDRTVTALRKLDEFPVFVRYNDAIDIINKVKRKQENSIVSTISSRNPFGFPTNYRGEPEPTKNTYKIFSSQGLGYVNKTEVAQGSEFISKYKIMISRVTSEHAGEPDKSGMYKVISKMQILEPGELCTDSYIVIYPSDSLSQVTNCFNYLQTKFARFLIMQTLSSINLSRDKYEFVPTQDFSKPWTDKELYEKYGLTEDEITFIESTIKPMDAGGDLNA
jgi:site-specific DNA-methyltransferase (adenine-specific)